jgi:hypothetical protein
MLTWGKKGDRIAIRPLDRDPAFDRLSPTLIRSHLYNFGFNDRCIFQSKM